MSKRNDKLKKSMLELFDLLHESQDTYLWKSKNDDTTIYLDKEFRFHNENGPARYSLSEKYEYWHIHGIKHRIGGPSGIYFNLNTKIKHEEYFVNGILHREDGPAIINYLCMKNHDIWFYKGEKINCCSQEQFEKLLKLKAFW